MIHDSELLDKLSGYSISPYKGVVFRATRISLNALAPSTNGGRWAPVGEFSVLYTSLEREGALAETAFHLSQHTPLPRKPVALHRISLTARKTFHLIETDLRTLGVDMEFYRTINFKRTQEIGAAVAFLGCDGLIIPSARWSCENLVLFMDNQDFDNELNVLETEEIDWRSWAIDHDLLDKSTD